MPDREPRSIRLDPDVYHEFVAWVEATEESKRGEIGRHVENALKEYIDHGREARIEEKVDKVLARLSEQPTAHTHKQRGSETVEKCRAVHRRVTSNHGTTIKADDVERAIEDIAGADDRTLDKYKSMLKRRCLLFKHPKSPVWTPEQDKFIEWGENCVDNDPTMEVHDIVEDCGLELDEYLNRAEAVVDR